MIQGVIYALSACLIWGLIYVVPQFSPNFSSIEVVLGCYFFYGLVSVLMFFKSHLNGKNRYSKAIWMKAFELSLVSTIIYYTFVVLALRHSPPAICTLILGISPITIAFYSNWQQKEIGFKSLIVPSILILIGLVIINAPQLETRTYSGYFFDLTYSFLALVAWTWYVVANARFLKQHPGFRSSDWTTLVGVATLFWVFFFALILSITFGNHIQMEKYLTWNEELRVFLIGSAILGILCSWVGAFLWNKASQRLPVFLTGQLTVFETIFGVTFVYWATGTSPTLFETTGIILLLTAIVFGIRNFAKKKTYVSQINPH